MNHTPETRAKISRNTRHGKARARERKKESAKISKGALSKFLDGDTVLPIFHSLAEIAESEKMELAEMLGGADHVTAAERMLIDDIGTLGLPLRGVTAAYLQSGDPELATRIGTLIGQRRSSLALLGLQRRARPVGDLRSYLAERDLLLGTQNAIDAEPQDGREVEHSAVPDSDDPGPASHPLDAEHLDPSERDPVVKRGAE